MHVEFQQLQVSGGNKHPKTGNSQETLELNSIISSVGSFLKRLEIH